MSSSKSPAGAASLGALAVWAGMADLASVSAAAPTLVEEPAKVAVVLAAAAAISMLGPTSQLFALERLRPGTWIAGLVGVALIASIVAMGGGEAREFIYFEF